MARQAPQTALKIAEVLERVPDIRLDESGNVALQDLKSTYTLATIVVHSRMIPEQFTTVDQVATCFLMGARLRVDPFTALWNTAIINGRPTIFGDLPLAICQSRRGVHVDEWWELEEGVRLSRRPSYASAADWPDNLTACCAVKLRVEGGEDRQLAFETFSVADARAAKLIPNKDQSPWMKYRFRMLMFRARTFALRTACPEVMMGLDVYEEMVDTGQEPRYVDAEVLPSDLATPDRPTSDGGEGLHLLDKIRAEVFRSPTWDAGRFMLEVREWVTASGWPEFQGRTMKQALAYLGHNASERDLRGLLEIVSSPANPFPDTEEADSPPCERCQPKDHGAEECPHDDDEPEAPASQKVAEERPDAEVEDEEQEAEELRKMKALAEIITAEPITPATRLTIVKMVDDEVLEKADLSKILKVLFKVSKLDKMTEEDGLMLIDRIERAVIFDDLEAGEFQS